MRLMTLNIPWEGCDGVVDLAGIFSTTTAMADADLFCFQEVAGLD